MQQQSYNDGVVELFGLKNIAEAGGTPKDTLFRKERMCFERRTLGMTRYYSALQNNVKLGQLLRVQRRASILAGDVAVVDGVQYKIERVQCPKDVTPPSMDLELSRLEQYYAF